MSIAKNFRVTVNLSNFFHDHRTRARIFINEEIETIKDLQERIEKIFSIQNFHLSSQNEFLPPSEDARILQKDDTIWVMQNGENYESSHVPKVSCKKPNKSKVNSKKRSISVSLAEDLTEEDLQSPKKKKKKKKHDVDQNKDHGDISSPINNELKKKKKKKMKTSDIDFEEITEDVNMETFHSPMQQKIQDTLDDNSNDGVTTTIIDELNSPKNSVINIKNLLPVLHSHINAYNKKKSKNQANKTSTSREIEISPFLDRKAEPDKEQNRFTCKGNLPYYKKKIHLPTITDEYLSKKKVNIVKIEYLGGPPPTLNGKESDSTELKNKDEKCLLEQNLKANDIHDIVSKDQAEDTISDTVMSNIPENNDGRENCTTKDNSLKTAESAKILEIYPSATCDTINKKYSNSSNGTNNISNTKSMSAFNEWKALVKGENDRINLKTTLSSSNKKADPAENEINITDESPVKDTLSNESNLDMHRFDTNKTPTHPVDTGKVLTSDVTVDTTRIVLKKPRMPNRQKYFFFKETTLNHGNSPEVMTNENSVSPTKLCTNPAKQDSVDGETPRESFVEANDMQVALSQTNEVPDQSAYELPDMCDKELSNLDFPHANNKDLDMRPDHKSPENTAPIVTVNETLPTVDSVETPKKLDENAWDSKISMEYDWRDSDTSAMDLTKSVTSNLEKSECSAVLKENTSKYSKRKQQSGVGQFLEDLRSNDSIVSIESVESDCSEFVTKRQRRRVRKRKKKDPKYTTDSSLNDSSLMITPIQPVQQKLMDTKACPSIHIKFDENEDETELKATDLTKDKHPKNESYIESISLRSDLDESKIGIPVIKEEDILKSPSMKKMFPKIGDLIAFKVLRITDNYTPEVSSYITGKVMDFNTVSKQIAFEILSGLDQCEEPKGKLSLQVDEKREKVGDSRREFIWMDLLDPRLLYP